VSSLLLASVPYATVFLARVIGSDESEVHQNLGEREDLLTLRSPFPALAGLHKTIERVN
jgi:hypothetical protein